MATVIVVAVLVAFCCTAHAQNFTETPDNSCELNLCEEGKHCYLVPEPVLGSSPYLCLGDGYRPGTCSLNAYLSCDKLAACHDSSDNLAFTCQCQDGVAGDGFQLEVNGTGCRLAFQPCSSDGECPEFGYCDLHGYRCACRPGFLGDGFNCTDIDECLSAPCHEHAMCQNSPGNFTCTCDALNGFVGDGKTCVFFCYNDNDCDVPRAKCDVNNKCQCMLGYQGNGLLCSDVDECSEGGSNNCSADADCVNTVGGYHCQCKNGFDGDGYSCIRRPQRCDDISNFQAGATYTIDPDFSGPANAFEVICDRVSGVVITKVPPTDIFPLAAPEDNTTLTIHYKPSPSDIIPLTEGAAFCYQDISFSCYSRFAMFPGTVWTDAHGRGHENWGSTKHHKCACGEVSVCPARCYCDGNQTQTLTTDSGQIVDKASLPVVNMTFSQDLKDKGRVNIGPLVCAQAPVNIPRDCHEAKFKQGLKKNTALYIDVDGPGVLGPALVYCDVESYSHVGITSVPPDSSLVVPPSGGEKEVTYNTGLAVTLTLIEGSVFCSQFVEFRCKNSRLSTGGGYVRVAGSNQRLSYFPGADGQEESCGCGATRSCEDSQVLCNCDIEDDRERKDFGLITNKAHLPVVGLAAVVGGTRSGAFRLGNLQCSQKQFGIEPNCEKYRATGTRENYTYPVDPDGPGGLPPFLVECRFLQSPPQGLTIVHHTNESQQTLTEQVWNIYYLQASASQLESLKNRSTVCTQEVHVTCRELSIHTSGGSTITWTGAGDGHFSLPQYMDTCGGDGNDCNCRPGAGPSNDSGILSDSDKLPVSSFDLTGVLDQLTRGGQLSMNLGPLVCSEVFPTCDLLKKFLSSGKAVEGEATVVNGKFTIDPDGAGGVEGFEVTCSFPATIISIESPVGGLSPSSENPSPVSTCFDISYKNDNGKPISAAQVTALVQRSGKCKQDLLLECQNAPASHKVNYTSCDGRPQTGWAGSFGEDKCACGVNGNCAGGPQASCNCDMADDVVRSDGGSLINKTSMPVCQICFSIDPVIPPGGGSGPTSMLRYKLGELKCDTDQGTKTNCQDARQKAGTTIKTVQEMAVPVSGVTDLPVGCRFFPDPPVGMLVVKASVPVNPPSVGNHTDIKVVYITISIHQVRQTFEANEYCSQNIFLFNATAQNLHLAGNWGFFTFDGRISEEWRELNGTSKYVQKACKDHADLCSKYGLPKGFSLTSKDDLPVTRILLSGAGVVVVVGDVECLDLKKSCQHLLDTNSKTTGLVAGKRYAIDPDGPRDIDPFVVNCEFDQTNGNGVSEVLPSGQWVGEVTVTGHKLPASFSLAVQYSGATVEQISALTGVSGFCWQWVVFNCRNTPLVNRTSPPNSFYDLYGRPTSLSFGTGPDVDSPGCACSQTGTCVSGYSCNCDALGRLAVDQGAVTNKSLLPITKVFVGGQQASTSSAKVKVTGVRCSSLPIDPPRDCADALKAVSRYGVAYAYSGEYLISPAPRTVKPFMVRCEFDFSPGVGVTVIKVVSESILLSKPGRPANVSYHAPSLDQLLALISQSKYCYQSVKYQCRSSTLFSEGGYWLSAGSAEQRTFWGGGQPRSGGQGGVCACGQEQNCGGLDSASGQRTRPCNCDFGDNTTRLDAGIISAKDYLPVSKFVVGPAAKFAEASLMVGDLYCSQEPLKFNECELDLSDCHPLASCVDQEVGYRCVCPPGWNGKGVVTSSEQARANGRECIDDDECTAAKPCPYSATCVNTPGDFKCECLPGYRPTGKTTCQDINECTNSTLNDCDPHAYCENLDGSYRCVCSRGYRGDGRTCIPVGDCVCFGDPHCVSYDNRWLHLQDECDYVMSQDGCRGDQVRTFRIEIQTWKRASEHPGKFSYVRSVRVYIFGKEIRLEQGGRIVVDGRVVRQYYDGHRFGVSVLNNRTQLWTVSDLLVTWDGQDVVQVTVPRNAMDSVCGLCGNYNGSPVDDTVQGPACQGNTGIKTENAELFIQSWITENTTCHANCRPDQPGSSDNLCIYPRPLVERECGTLMDVTVSPFKDCLKLKEPTDLRELLLSCVYDLCHVEEELEAQVCRFAEILAWDCSENEKVNVSRWKSKFEACEVPQCPNNLIYQSCGSVSQRTCLSLALEQSPGPAQCLEGCFCEAHLVLEGDRCLSPDQCGCFYDNGYLAVGDKITLPDCTLEVECVGNNVTVKLPAGCDWAEECRTEDGVIGCFCIEGYIRNSEGKCARDACHKVECKIPHMTCINGSCLCRDGYIGDCYQCEDVNECEIGAADCGRVGQTCLNTDGSFRCVCEEGFVRDGKICKDIDECEYAIDGCGDNTECVNTPGSFRCECCVGYKRSNSSTCVRDPTVAAAARCCACQGKCCDDPGQVCGTDGKTYSSYRTLSITSCRTGNNQLKVNYKGPCKGTCETVVCDKHYSTCVMKDEVPTCLCPTCSDTSSSYEDITVCGTDNVTYTSKCNLEAVTCKAHYEVKVEVQFTGRPCPGHGPPLTGPWGDWSDCSEDCKQGVRTRTREVYVHSSDVTIHSVETIPCYSTCDQGPCRQDTCTGPAQVCVADESNAPSCVCPMCADFPEDLICGRLGLVIHTFSTECELNRTACEKHEPDFEVLEPRACEEKPVNCGLVRKYAVFVDDNGCEADRSINFGECYGGCDQEADLCCFGNETSEKSATMYCPDHTHIERSFKVTTGCNCVSKTEAFARQMLIVP